MPSNQPTPERFSIKSVLQAIVDTFDVNKGFIKTFRLLTVRPGESIRSFLLGDRALLTKPFQLLIVSTAVVSFLTIQLADRNPFLKGFEEGVKISKSEQVGQSDEDVEEMARLTEKKDVMLRRVGESFSRYFNLVILLSIPFMALASYWFFKKSGFNYAEHIVFNAYILSYQNLIYLLFAPFIYFVSAHFSWPYLLLAYGYFVYACIRFFQTKTWLGIIKSISAIIIGSFFYFVCFTAITVVVVLVLVNNSG